MAKKKKGSKKVAGAKRRKAMVIPLNQLESPKRPLAPWDDDTTRQMWVKSQVDGHRRLGFKCTMCGLEYRVLTWRNGDPDVLSDHFKFCPECGNQGRSVCTRFDHEIGRICDADS